MTAPRGDVPVGTKEPSASESPSRSCGTCFACCKWLGIEALSKYAGQMCKHVTGPETPRARCSIYTTRPKACVTYRCAWLDGLGTDFMRPDSSGLLVSVYGPTENAPETPLSATVVITDFDRCGNLQQGNMKLLTDGLLDSGFDDIRIVSFETKVVIHIYAGAIYRGQLRSPDKTDADRFESLNFETYNPPIGKYERKELAS